MAIAAWVGLLVTMINLMPIGQPRRRPHRARRVRPGPRTLERAAAHRVADHRARRLGTMFIMASRAGKDFLGSLGYAKHGRDSLADLDRAARRHAPPHRRISSSGGRSSR